MDLFGRYDELARQNGLGNSARESRSSMGDRDRGPGERGEGSVRGGNLESEPVSPSGARLFVGKIRGEQLNLDIRAKHGNTS